MKLNSIYKGLTPINKMYRNGNTVNKIPVSISSGTTPSRLPQGYVELDCIENTAKAYINTGFKPNQDTRILLTMQSVTSTNGGVFCGAGGWDLINGMWVDYENGTTGSLHISWGTKTSWSVFNNVKGDFNVHEYDWNKNSFYRDGTLIQTVTYGAFQCTDNLGLFAPIQNGGAPSSQDQYVKGKLYSCKIYDDGTLVRDLVPCTNPSNVVGVYDIVNDVFYGSASNNTFTAGSPVSPTGGTVYDAEIEYLGNSGTQYIDTGIYLNTSNFEIGSTIDGENSRFGYCHENVVNGTWLSIQDVRAWFGKFSNNGTYDVNMTSYLTSGENTIVYTQSGITINGTTISKNLSMGSDSISNIPLLFFAVYDFNANAIEYNVNYPCKYKSFYIKNNGTLVFDAIPVRVGQVGYMYDRVSGQLFGNQGTGNFILGNDITPTPQTTTDYWQYVAVGSQPTPPEPPSGLPQGYTEVEYIKNYISTANAYSTLAYLDTNFTPTEKTRVLIDMQIDKATKNPRLLGSGVWNGLGYIVNCEETVGQSNSYIYYKFGQNSTWYHTTVHPDLLRHTIDYNNNGEFLLDGTSIATLPTTSFTAPISMGVFTGRRTGSTVVDLSETFYGKVYSCKIYEDGTLVRDFVPCIDPNSVAGFYDLVNNLFYGSANNNTFTAGNPV